MGDKKKGKKKDKKADQFSRKEQLATLGSFLITEYGMWIDPQNETPVDSAIKFLSLPQVKEQVVVLMAEQMATTVDSGQESSGGDAP